jgi:hypothetical protein
VGGDEVIEVELGGSMASTLWDGPLIFREGILGGKSHPQSVKHVEDLDD